MPTMKIHYSFPMSPLENQGSISYDEERLRRVELRVINIMQGIFGHEFTAYLISKLEISQKEIARYAVWHEIIGSTPPPGTLLEDPHGIEELFYTFAEELGADNT